MPSNPLQATTTMTEGFIYKVLKDIGVPFVLAYVILTQTTPKIDEGIRIAERVDAQLSFELQQHAQMLAECGIKPIVVVPAVSLTPSVKP